MGIRTWHRGMLFRFILFLWRHHSDCMVGRGMRIRTWHRGLSFRFILRLRRLQVIGGDARRYKGDTRRGGQVQQDARRWDVIHGVWR